MSVSIVRIQHTLQWQQIRRAARAAIRASAFNTSANCFLCEIRTMVKVI
jgi:hypothetical protein